MEIELTVKYIVIQLNIIVYSHNFCALIDVDKIGKYICIGL